jgi:hypothetical protein
MDRGYSVVICDVKDCSTAAKVLAARHPNGQIFHTKCDVSDAKSVEALGKFAQQKLGKIGYWINNAGINGGRRALMDVPVGMVEAVVKVNLLGVLLGTKVAMDIMSQQVSRLRDERSEELRVEARRERSDSVASELQLTTVILRRLTEYTTLSSRTSFRSRVYFYCDSLFLSLLLQSTRFSFFLLFSFLFFTYTYILYTTPTHPTTIQNNKNIIRRDLKEKFSTL